MSRASILSPCGPIATPATINPIIWGILNLLRTTGDNKIITRTIKNINTGDVTNGVVVAKIMVNKVCFLFGSAKLINSF